jgi:GR25 family glycosyltransferase involved in LPS biosynthesis
MSELIVPIFVLSIPEATQEQEQVKKHMQNLDIPFEFVFGTVGRLLNEEELQKIFDKKKSYNYYKWYRNRTGSAGIELTKAEIGATLGHKKIYKKIVDENIEWAVILEHDVLVTEDFLPIVEKIIAMVKRSSIKKNFVIKLDNTLGNRSHTFGDKGIGKLIKKGKSIKFLRPTQVKIDKELAITKTSMNFGPAQGYIIDNMAAHKMLQLNYPIFLLCDEWHHYARFVTVRALNKNIAPCKIENSYVWMGKWPEYIPIPFKYRYLGLVKKLIIKIYLLLLR